MGDRAKPFVGNQIENIDGATILTHSPSAVDKKCVTTRVTSHRRGGNQRYRPRPLLRCGHVPEEAESTPAGPFSRSHNLDRDA